MSILSHLEPREVFHYFEELTGIPRPSEHMKPVSDYCVAFAKEYDLEYIQDESFNIIIKKPGTKGYEASEPVILQGHLDMVAVKTGDSEHDFYTEPLELFIEDGWIGAKNTSLGGDNGIAIAYALAILASDNLPHPPIEAVFTTDEESTLNGAYSIDLSVLNGTKCLNIDSEEEGVLTVGCAGGCNCEVHLPIYRSSHSGSGITIFFSGLSGGHSGMEIGLQRGNANKLMGRLLNQLSKKYAFRLAEINGGSAINVIAQSSKAVIVAEEAQTMTILAAIDTFARTIRAEFAGQETQLSLTAQAKPVAKPVAKQLCFDEDTTRRVISYLATCPDGVQYYDRAFPTEIETSLNLGTVETKDDEVHLIHLLRSSIESRLNELSSQLDTLADVLGAGMTITGEYPSWSYRPDSRLRPLLVHTYRRMFGKEPFVGTTHGGLECGILSQKKPELDIVSFGPDIKDVHSVNERLHIESAERTWEYLKKILEACR